MSRCVSVSLQRLVYWLPLAGTLFDTCHCQKAKWGIYRVDSVHGVLSKHPKEISVNSQDQIQADIELLQRFVLHDGRLLVSLTQHESGWIELQSAIQAVQTKDGGNWSMLAHEAALAYAGGDWDVYAPALFRNVTMTADAVMDNLLQLVSTPPVA